MNPTDKGEILKRAGIESVIDGETNWHAAAMTKIRQLMVGLELSGEQIRSIVQNQCGPPRNPNSWGALISSAAKQQFIVDTGKTTRCSIPSNHARKVTIWRTMGSF